MFCNADDTPRYTGPFNLEKYKKDPYPGVGQVKMCNDWSRLESWAAENTACFRAINITDPDFPTIERYKYCPDGRILWD